jgi:hypothetical protein|tara:strand:- start:8773 stop:8982 length:210 start_codon:yes stop_codon:yes gene_type:complete
MVKKKKQDIEEEIIFISAFGFGVGTLYLFLAFHIFLGVSFKALLYSAIIFQIFIIIRMFFLKRKLKRIK